MEIKVFTGNSTRSLLTELLPQFEQLSGHAVAVSYDPATIMLQRIEKGEAADLAILGEPAIDELIRNGKIEPSSRRVLAHLGAGMAVRTGAPRPDIGSVEAFKRTLLDAHSIAYASAGTTGIHFVKVIAQLGISEQVLAKSLTRPGGLIGGLVVAGQADLVIQQIPELMAVPGIELLGPFPAELQKISVTTAGIFAGSRQAAAARTLLDFLMTPSAASVFKAKGLQPVF